MKIIQKPLLRALGLVGVLMLPVPLCLADDTINTPAQTTINTVTTTAATHNQTSNETAAIVLPKTSPPIAKIEPLDTRATIIKTFGGLAVIIVLIMLCAKVSTYFTQQQRSKQPILQLISVLPLGSKEKLALVEVGGKQLLIGVTAHNISPLLELAESIKPTTQTPTAQSTLSAKTAAEFSKKLNEFLNAGNRHS